MLLKHVVPVWSPSLGKHGFEFPTRQGATEHRIKCCEGRRQDRFQETSAKGSHRLRGPISPGGHTISGRVRRHNRQLATDLRRTASPSVSNDSVHVKSLGDHLPHSTLLERPLLSVSTSQPAPYELVRCADLLATQVDQGLLVIIDGDYECRVGSPASQQPVAWATNTFDVVVSLVPGE